MLYNYIGSLPKHIPQTGGKLKIFISYGREDITNEFAVGLHEILKSYNYEPVLDVKDFIAGESLSGTISSEIASSDVMIVILSKKYSHSTWCTDELIFAKGKGKKIILLKREECDISDQIKFLLGDRLYLKFITDEECKDNLQKLITALER